LTSFTFPGGRLYLGALKGISGRSMTQIPKQKPLKKSRERIVRAMELLALVSQHLLGTGFSA
jgi:hypothetical protein